MNNTYYTVDKIHIMLMFLEYNYKCMILLQSLRVITEYNP